MKPLVVATVIAASLFFGCAQRVVTACCDVHATPCAEGELEFKLSVSGFEKPLCSPCDIVTLAGALEGGRRPLLCVE